MKLIEHQLGKIFLAGKPVQVRAPLPGSELTGGINARDAVRWLALEAGRCRDRDSCEAFCLLLPALLRILQLPKMSEAEAAAFREKFKERLR